MKNALTTQAIPEAALLLLNSNMTTNGQQQQPPPVRRKGREPALANMTKNIPKRKTSTLTLTRTIGNSQREKRRLARKTDTAAGSVSFAKKKKLLMLFQNLDTMRAHGTPRLPLLARLQAQKNYAVPEITLF